VAKRTLIILGIVGMTLSLIGCDTRDNKNIEIMTELYINTSETVKINGYNGYKLVSSEIINNEDGSYSINVKMDKPIK